MEVIDAKVGDTFLLTCTRETAGGSIFDLTGYTVAARISDGTFTEDLTGTITNATAGEFTISQTAANTASWPAGTFMACDIEFTLGSLVESTETFRLAIEDDVTP